MKLSHATRVTLMGSAASALLALSACGGGSKPAASEVETCPSNSTELDGATEVLHCSCSSIGIGSGVVFGSGPYLSGSSICRSAVHAGAISEDDDNVVVSVTPVDPAGVEFPASEANGVSSSEYISSSPASGAFNVE